MDTPTILIEGIPIQTIRIVKRKDGRSATRSMKKMEDIE